MQLLHIDLEPIAFLMEAVSDRGDWLWVDQGVGQGEENGVEQGVEPWLHRFLRSPLLRHLEPRRWQRLLRAASVRPLGRGDHAVRQGEPGDEFFVLRSGTAEVVRNGLRLAVLQPGEFFGEDALLTGAPRNASVRMLTPGQLLVLERGSFLALLAHQVLMSAQRLQSSTVWAAGSRVWVGRHARTGWLHVPLIHLRERLCAFDARPVYVVAGDTLGEGALAVLLCAQFGLNACIDDTGALSATRLEVRPGVS